MLNYNKNDLIDECNRRFFQSYQYTCDVADYVPKKVLKDVYKYLSKNFRKQYKKIDKEDRKYQRAFKKFCKVNKITGFSFSEYAPLPQSPTVYIDTPNVPPQLTDSKQP